MTTINTTIAAAAADSPDNATLNEALRLAELGFYVFPCKPGTKIPLTKNGFKSATCDAEQIRAWWTRCPDANLAVATEGFLALDIDGAENPYLADEARAASVSAYPQSRTPRGGRHFLMAQPVGRPVRNSAGQLAEHVDIRANGGYIVVAPSAVDGKSYQWETPLLIGADSLPPMPDWLEAALESLKSGKRKKRGGPIPEGRRNSELTSRAGRMRRAGLVESQIAEQLLQVNRAECQPPLEEEEVRKIAASAMRYESDATTATTRIIVAPDEARVTDEALTAMVADPDIYSRGTRLVRVVRAGLGANSLQGGLVITDLPIASLREKMSRRIPTTRTTRLDHSDFPTPSGRGMARRLRRREGWQRGSSSVAPLVSIPEWLHGATRDLSCTDHLLRLLTPPRTGAGPEPAHDRHRPRCTPPQARPPLPA